MPKRILSLVIAIIMTITLIIPVYSAKAEISIPSIPWVKTYISNIKIGDYVELGKYNDQAILWRCVDINGNGPLMLADKILTIKAFDATSFTAATPMGKPHKYLNGNNQTDHTGLRCYGSNLWSTSNMRSWLNSSASAENVDWLDGCPPTAETVNYNAYDQEKGFLAEGNFSANERTAIKSVTQKSLINSIDVNSNLITGGTQKHIYSEDIADVVQNYDTAYFENITDNMFLLDVKQLNKVYQNGSTFGFDYWIGKLTQKAVEKSNYKFPDYSSFSEKFIAGAIWFNWVRSPEDSEFTYANEVRYVGIDGYVRSNMASDSKVGVRPAFYINRSSEIFRSGNGGKSTPYSLIGIKVITPPTKINYVVGQKIDLTGLLVTETYNGGITPAAVLVTAANISGFNSTTPIIGQPITVTVNGYKAIFYINIIEKALTSIAITTPPTKVQYVVGQTIDLAGLVVTGSYNDGTTEIVPITAANISGFNSTTPATSQPITVTVDGKTTTFNIDIIAKTFISDIKIGDYLGLGKYNDESILWRCVDIDENGPLMLADQILTIKAFDAAAPAGKKHKYLNGNNQADINDFRTDHGSNLWSTSNMRSWLNSSESAGNVDWLDGCPPTLDKVGGYNAYDQEKGFLEEGNFNANEKTAIKNVTQKSLLSSIDVNSNLITGGTAIHEHNGSIADVVQNYDNAYFENVADNMFLLDVKQLNKVYQNGSILGTDYWIGKPTQKAVEKSTFKEVRPTYGSDWYNWNRSPHFDSSNPYYVRLASSSGYVGFSNANNVAFGARPAFYINLSSSIFKSGNGSRITPYVVASESGSVKVITAKSNVSKNKKWNIKLNLSVNPNDINNYNIYVVDKNNNIFPTKVYQNTTDNTVICVESVKEYTVGEIYTIWIRELKSIDGKKVLKNNVKMNFIIGN